MRERGWEGLRESEDQVLRKCRHPVNHAPNHATSIVVSMHSLAPRSPLDEVEAALLALSAEVLIHDPVDHILLI